jgi:hypothetical protein
LTVLRAALVSALLLAFLGALVAPANSVTAATLVSQRYTLTSTLDWTTGRLDTRERLEWRNNSGATVSRLNLSVLARQLGIFTLLSQPTVGGKPATTSWTTGTNLRVNFPTPLSAGSATVIDLTFRLSFGPDQSDFGALMARNRGVLNAASWFPIWSREHDFYPVGDPQCRTTPTRSPSS